MGVGGAKHLTPDSSQQIIKVFKNMQGCDWALLAKNSAIAAITEKLGEKADLAAQIQITSPGGKSITLPFKFTIADNTEEPYMFQGTMKPEVNKE